jgi:hypothetical protein
MGELAIAGAVANLIANGIKICLGVYGTIDNIKQAPRHIVAISADLKTFYSILASIEVCLDEDDLKRGLLHRQSYDSLRQVLLDGVNILKAFHKIIHRYLRAGRECTPSLWQRLQWSWKEADVKRLRTHLMDNKQTLSVALSMAHLL